MPSSFPSLSSGFQSTLPAGGATLENETIYTNHRFQSTLPAGGATDLATAVAYSVINISIHAPRRGSDECQHQIFAYIITISIHAPRRGSDIFHRFVYCCSWQHFNPRSPQGERHGEIIKTDGISISIHAPRRGSDPLPDLAISLFQYFNPRSPQGERRSAAVWGL